MIIAALVENWWIVAMRGAFAVLFGLSVLLWPGITLSTVVMLFAAYAILDGVWALASAVRTSEHLLDAWPVALEGVVSLAIGTVALASPFVSRALISWLVAWGLVTGAREIVGASRLPREVAGHWLLATGGASSLFLAMCIAILPHASVRPVAAALGVYALLFGALVSVAAFRFRRRTPSKLRTVAHRSPPLHHARSTTGKP